VDALEHLHLSLLLPDNHHLQISKVQPTPVTPISSLTAGWLLPLLWEFQSLSLFQVAPVPVEMTVSNWFMKLFTMFLETQLPIMTENYKD
jgi:hypothetical protein